jgi:hypothetical protein
MRGRTRWGLGLAPGLIIVPIDFPAQVRQLGSVRLCLLGGSYAKLM